MTPAEGAVLDRMAALLAYPDGELRGHLRALLAGPAAIPPAALAELAKFAEAVAATPLGALQEEYTATFDLTPACALDVGWHLFGDAHERGAFMAALRDDLRQAGVPERTELPDHLTHVLRLVGRQPAERAATLAALVAPVVETVLRGVAGRPGPYVHALAGVRDVLAGLAAAHDPEVMRP